MYIGVYRPGPGISSVAAYLCFDEMLNPFFTFRLCEKISVDAYEPAKFMGEFTSWYFYLLLIYAGEFVILFRESNTDFFEIIFHRCVCLRTRSL